MSTQVTLHSMACVNARSLACSYTLLKTYTDTFQCLSFVIILLQKIIEKLIVDCLWYFDRSDHCHLHTQRHSLEDIH